MKHFRLIPVFILLTIFYTPLVLAVTDSDLKQIAIYKTISTYYPKEYQELLKKNNKNSSDSLEFKNDTQSLISYAMGKSIPNASSEAIYYYLKINYEFQKKLYTENPLLVLAVEFPGRIPSDSIASLIPLIQESDMVKVMQAKAGVIESGSKNKTPFHFTEAEKEKVKANFQQIMASLDEKYGQSVVDDTFNSTGPFQNTSKSAETVLSLYELMLAKGQEEGSLLLKSLYTN